HAIPNDFRFRGLQNDNCAVLIRHECDWLRIAGIIVTQRCGNRMRARFFTFERDMRFPIGLSDGNTVIFRG
ncbi:hypothetical protein, partial [Escherichia coli]|uniref:hypothetical protein n=1 Tax=Escherichia coli TaxID=562 RepID=UPI003D804342